MAHKVRCDVVFQDMEEYLTMKKHLDNAGIKFDSFVTYSLNHTWNLMLEQYSAQLKGEQTNDDEPAGTESSGNAAEVSFGEGADSPASSDGPAVSP